MRLFDWYTKYDFGHEIIFALCKGKKYSLLQISVDWNDCGGGPYLQISSGMGRAFSLLFSVGRFGLGVDILGHNWETDYLDIEISITKKSDETTPKA